MNKENEILKKGIQEELLKQMKENLHHPSFDNHLERYVLSHQIDLLTTMSFNVDEEIKRLVGIKNENDKTGDFTRGKIKAMNDISAQCLDMVVMMIKTGTVITQEIREREEEIPWSI